jgi:hypothetical protein
MLRLFSRARVGNLSDFAVYLRIYAGLPPDTPESIQSLKIELKDGDNWGTDVRTRFIFFYLERRSGLENRCSTRRNDYK